MFAAFPASFASDVTSITFALFNEISGYSDKSAFVTSSDAAIGAFVPFL